jgi:hypothetical protein
LVLAGNIVTHFSLRQALPVKTRRIVDVSNKATSKILERPVKAVNGGYGHDW